MNKKLSLQEATLMSLYNDLEDGRDATDVEGVMDGIIVVTDPEIDSEQYNELINRAGELVEDTPEGEIPMSEDYLGQYVQMCPICGTTFIEHDMLTPGSACPICYATPDSFVMLGQLASQEDVQKDIELSDTDINEENEDKKDEETPTELDNGFEDVNSDEEE